MSTAEKALRAYTREQDRIVTDEDVDKALHFLRDSARQLGDLRRKLMEADSLVKRTKALVMRIHSDKSLGAAEREAIASAEYEHAETEAAIVAGDFECLKALREAAAAKIECWRTEQSTLRSMKL